MNSLISNLLHWFLYGGTLFFAAGAVAAVAEPAAAAPAAPAAEPAAPAAPATEPSIADIVKESATEAAAELTKPAAEAQPAAEPVKPAAEPAKPAAEPAKPAAEAKPAEATPNPLDKLGPLPAEKITAALAEAPPEVQQFLKDKGLSVESLTANARMAAEGVQYKERFPTLEAADTALEGAQQFWKLDAGLPAVKTVADFDKFMSETLVPMSFLRDAKGQPIPDPDNPGAFKNDGSIGKLIDFSASVRDSNLSELADMMLKGAQTDEAKAFATDLKGAVEFVGAFINNGYKMPGEKKEAPKYTPEDQARLDRAARIEQESHERDSSTQRQALDQKEDRIIDQTTKMIEPTIKAVLDKSAFTPELKTRITNMVWNELTETMLKNALYLRERDQLSPSAQDYEQRRVALNKSYMQERVVKILESIVGDFGGPVVDANKTRIAKLDSQSDAARMDPKTSGTTPQSHPVAATTDQAHAKAMEMARAENPNAKEGGPEYWRAVLKLDMP